MTDFESWLVAREPALHRLAALLTDAHTAQDLVQATLTKMYLAWDRLEDRDQLDAYARRVLLNEHHSRWRRAWRRREQLVRDPPEHAVLDQALASADNPLWPLVTALPDRQRTVVVLRYYEQLTDSEIAALLGISTGTVKSQSSRALAKIREQLQEVET